MARVRLYDVRVEYPSGARRTVRKAGVDAQEARTQALHQEYDAARIVSCRRSQYAVTAAHLADRRAFLEAA